MVDKNETMKDLEEINTDEINRLKAIPEEKKLLMSSEQLSSLNARLDKLKLDLDDKKMQNSKLTSELQLV